MTSRRIPAARVLGSALTAWAVATGVVVGAGSAQALTATPSTRAFVSPAVDAAATWERESGCDQTVKKGPKRLRKLLTATYGAMPSNILRPCSAADSGHEEGRAIDWMVNVRDAAQKETAESFLTWLTAPDQFGNVGAMARRLGVSYVIWNNAMWRPADGLWTDYSDCAKPKRRYKRFDNSCHRNHIHVSFSWDGALGRTSFYTGYVACPAPYDDPWPAVLTPAAPEVVPVEPVRVLGTRAGVGVAGGPCRVHPDVRLDIPVLGVGAVPATGVSAVTLRVTADRLDAPAELRVWTAGGEPSLTPVATADKGVPATVEVTVPVGADGLVSLALAGGMGHLAVDVTGYSVAATT